MLKLNTNSIIYIVTPANLTSGGPDALHQLYYYFLKAYPDKKCNIKIAYADVKQGIDPTAERYKIYGVEYVTKEEIVDDVNNVLIMPESVTHWLNDYNNIQKCIWWLSVCIYDGYTSKFFEEFIKRSIKGLLKCDFSSLKYLINKRKQCPDFRSETIHNFCASKFAYNYVKSKGAKHVDYLIEPISLQFLNAGKATNLQGQARNNIVLYNPAKTSRKLKQITKDNRFQFVPLKGYSVEQLVEKYRQAKLYIDFGNFPGPERIPKETVYNGMVIMVGKKNASKNDFDVAIPKKYKVGRYSSVKTIIKKMQYMLDNYDKIIGDFSYFADKVDKLESNFVSQIKNIFKFEGEV